MHWFLPLGLHDPSSQTIAFTINFSLILEQIIYLKNYIIRITTRSQGRKSFTIMLSCKRMDINCLS